MSKKAYFYIILFLLIISLPVILPFFHQGYFPTHDGEWAVVRMAEMFREIRDHQFPARYSGYLNFGYGYPLFNFAYPFPYYLGTGLHLLGFGFVVFFFFFFFNFFKIFLKKKKKKKKFFFFFFFFFFFVFSSPAFFWMPAI